MFVLMWPKFVPRIRGPALFTFARNFVWPCLNGYGIICAKIYSASTVQCMLTFLMLICFTLGGTVPGVQKTIESPGRLRITKKKKNNNRFFYKSKINKKIKTLHVNVIQCRALQESTAKSLQERKTGFFAQGGLAA